MSDSHTQNRGGRPLARAEVSTQAPLRVQQAASLGALVRAERVGRGLNQAEMAARLGVSRGLLAGLERGDRGVRLDLVLQVLADLGIELVAIPSGAHKAP